MLERDMMEWRGVPEAQAWSWAGEGGHAGWEAENIPEDVWALC